MSSSSIRPGSTLISSRIATGSRNAGPKPNSARKGHSTTPLLCARDHYGGLVDVLRGVRAWLLHAQAVTPARLLVGGKRGSLSGTAAWATSRRLSERQRAWSPSGTQQRPRTASTSAPGASCLLVRDCKDGRPPRGPDRRRALRQAALVDRVTADAVSSALGRDQRPTIGGERNLSRIGVATAQRPRRVRQLTQLPIDELEPADARRAVVEHVHKRAADRHAGRPTPA